MENKLNLYLDMKKRNQIALLFCVMSVLMTSLSMSEKFLSINYLIKNGLALLFLFGAIIVLIIELVKQNKSKKYNAPQN